jgi:hypothetical protein
MKVFHQSAHTRIACAAVTAADPANLGVSLAGSTDIEKESDDEPEGDCPAPGQHYELIWRVLLGDLALILLP